MPEETESKATWMIYATRLQRGFVRAENKLKEFGLSESERWSSEEMQRYLEKHSALKKVALISRYQHVNKPDDRTTGNV